jgi:hypothetical protein
VTSALKGVLILYHSCIIAAAATLDSDLLRKYIYTIKIISTVTMLVALLSPLLTRWLVVLSIGPVLVVSLCRCGTDNLLKTGSFLFHPIQFVRCIRPQIPHVPTCSSQGGSTTPSYITYAWCGPRGKFRCTFTAEFYPVLRLFEHCYSHNVISKGKLLEETRKLGGCDSTDGNTHGHGPFGLGEWGSGSADSIAKAWKCPSQSLEAELE